MNICIFCGAKSGNDPLITEQVEQLMVLLTAQKATLIYGGGNAGLMGLIADRFIAAGQKVIGIRPQKLIEDEAAHLGIDEMIVVQDMFERKAKMMEMAEVFIALPGGVGTLDEIIEVYTQVKIGFAQKLCTVLNTDNFYAGLDSLLSKMESTGFLRKEDQALLYLEPTPEALMRRILAYQEAH